MVDWQYRDLTIPLGFERATTVHGHLSDRGAEERGRRAARERYQQLVAEQLRGAAEQGWEPAHPVDFDAVAREGRLRVSTRVTKDATTFAFGQVRSTTITHMYEAVTIRLRRPAP